VTTTQHVFALGQRHGINALLLDVYTALELHPDDELRDAIWVVANKWHVEMRTLRRDLDNRKEEA